MHKPIAVCAFALLSLLGTEFFAQTNNGVGEGCRSYIVCKKSSTGPGQEDCSGGKVITQCPRKMLPPPTHITKTGPPGNGGGARPGKP